MPVAEAFKEFHAVITRPTAGFAAALRKEKLSIVMADGSELTTMKAVDELFSRQREAPEAKDRNRKAAAEKEGSSEHVEWKYPRAKSGQIRRKAEHKKQKAEATKQKADVRQAT